MKINTSLEKILELNSLGKTNKYVAEKLNISVSMVEKSLQLKRLRDKLKEKLNQDQYSKLVSLNYKALQIKNLVNDVDSIKVLLNNIKPGAPAAEVKKYIELALARNDKINFIIKEIDTITVEINNQKEAIKRISVEYDRSLNDIDIIFNIITENKDLTEERKKVLYNTVAYNKLYDEWVLVGLLDKNKVFKLKALGCIEQISSEKFIQWGWSGDNRPYIIKDIDKFIHYVARSKSFEVESLDYGIQKEGLVWPKKAADSLEEINRIKMVVDEEVVKLVELKKELNRIKESALYDCMSEMEPKNYLSKKNTLEHEKIAHMGMKWLVENGYMACMEYPYKNYRFDVIGVNILLEKIVILEIKTTDNDYKQDIKKYRYMAYCNELYIITNKIEVAILVQEEANIGCLFLDGDGKISIMKKPITQVNIMLNYKEVATKINMILLNKIYGVY